MTHGNSVTLRVAVTAQNSALNNAIVDLEIYNAAGKRVHQKAWSGQTLTPGQALTLSDTWTAPSATGVYRVAVGVFTASWATDLLWANQATTVTVQ